MRQIAFSLSLLAGLFLLDINISQAANKNVGQTTVIYKDVFADSKKLEVNDSLQVGETLITKSEARLHAEMIDGSVLMLGENARFQIDELAYDANQAQASFQILSGAFRMISGEITKRPNNQVTLSTPIATIGIRGTDFWGIVAEDSLSIALLDDSEIVVVLPTGPVTLNSPMTLLNFKRGDTRPSLYILTEDVLTEAVKTILPPN